MGSERRRTRLGKHVDLLTGFPFKSDGFSAATEDVRLVRGDNVAQGWLRWENVRRWPASASADLEKYLLWPGDVVVAMDRPWIQAGLKYARVRDFDTPSLLVQRVARLRARDGLSQSYLALIIGSAAFTEYVLNVQTGTTVPHISASQIRDFDFELPPMKVQEEAASTIDSIDERIDNLVQTNATSESIAQAVFKSWFVDFDPVRANAEGREPEGMDAATAALFPSRFQESAMGQVPVGWTTGTLAELSELNASKWSARSHPESVRYIDLGGVRSNRIHPPSEQAFNEAPSRARLNLRDGDTIVGTVRPGNRAFAYIHRPAENLTGSTGFAVLSPRRPEQSSFVYLAATCDQAIERLANLADGAAYPAVRPTVVSDTPCVIPPESVMKAFSDTTQPLLERIAQNSLTAYTLASLRDTLLPRLISGKLRLPDAQLKTEGGMA